MRPILTLALLFIGATATIAQDDWVPVPLADADVPVADPAAWKSYRGAQLSPITAPDGSPGLHVSAGDPQYAGLRIDVAPRGGLGNRVRVELQARLISGPPVGVQVGPNSFNQVGAMIANTDWQPVRFEIGLLWDAPTVLHIAQPGPGGEFEIAGLSVAALGAEPGVRVALGPVDVAIAGEAGGDPSPLFVAEGNPAPTLSLDADGAYHLAAAATIEGPPAGCAQGVGSLPAGTRLELRGRARVAEGSGAGALALRVRGEERARAEVAGGDWQDIALGYVLPEDVTPQWTMGAAGADACDLRVADLQVLATLPDPVGPGLVTLPAQRRPIALATGDAKQLYITPPWPFAPRILAHLEYNSRWSFRNPDEHEARVSATGDALTMAWRFADDPVAYTVAMTADRPDAVLVEARLTNRGAEPTEPFRAGFCLQITGAWMPKSFAYTIIPREGRALRLDLTTLFAPTPEPWPRFGWVRADYAGSADYAARLAAGDAYVPDDRRVREVGDFPLLARRVPGRDAWIAWIWPDAAGYFGNAAAPCMHMDPVLPACPPGQTARMFGRMIFFEGTWDELYARAQTEREALAAMSGVTVGAEVDGGA